MEMKRTRLSLIYLAGYLTIIGLGLLIVPGFTLNILQASGDYGDIMPRVAGMLMSGLGAAIVGMILNNAYTLYPGTIAIRIFFLVCLISFYFMTQDPLFIVFLVVVAIGFVMTLGSFMLDRKS